MKATVEESWMDPDDNKEVQEMDRGQEQVAASA